MTLTAIGTTVAAAGGRGATVGNGPGRRRNEGGSRQNRTGSDRNAVGSPQNERGSAQRGPGSDERTAGSDLNWGCEHPERPPPLFERLERADSTRLVADTCTPCREQWIPLLREWIPPLRIRPYETRTVHPVRQARPARSRRRPTSPRGVHPSLSAAPPRSRGVPSRDVTVSWPIRSRTVRRGSATPPAPLRDRRDAHMATVTSSVALGGGLALSIRSRHAASPRRGSEGTTSAGFGCASGALGVWEASEHADQGPRRAQRRPPDRCGASSPW